MHCLGSPFGPRYQRANTSDQGVPVVDEPSRCETPISRFGLETLAAGSCGYSKKPLAEAWGLLNCVPPWPY